MVVQIEYIGYRHINYFVCVLVKDCAAQLLHDEDQTKAQHWCYYLKDVSALLAPLQGEILAEESSPLKSNFVLEVGCLIRDLREHALSITK